jgi:hypothetical protein
MSKKENEVLRTRLAKNAQNLSLSILVGNKLYPAIKVDFDNVMNTLASLLCCPPKRDNLKLL